MIARYKGQIVTVIRIEAHRALIVWRGMLKRVNRDDLVDVSLIATFALTLLGLAWLVLR